MADTFEGLGIAPELVEAVEAVGWMAPAGLQRDALPVIRRGNNVVLHASPGAGATGAYGLGIMDRLIVGDPDAEDRPDDAPDHGPRALVLVADGEAATRIADSLARFGRNTSLTVRALAPGWPARATDLMVASATAAVAAVQDSSLKLDGLVAVVVDGADQLNATDQWTALETVLEATPPGAQRVLVTGQFDTAVDGLIERHVRRAMTVPSRPVETPDPAAGAASTVRFVVIPEREKTRALVALIESTDAGELAVVCRTADRARRLATDLSARGLPVDGDGQLPAGEPTARLRVLDRLEADRRSTAAAVLSSDVPLDSDELVDLHARGGIILTTPRQLAHLRRIAARAGAALEATLLPTPAGLDALDAVRARLRQTAQGADLAADLALVEPLLDEFPAPVLAAAALHLARTSATPAGPAMPGARTSVASAGDAREAATPSAPPPTTTWVRLFVSAGSRDGLTPGDLVGAIAGETGLPGAEVGKIEIRESHSTVEVPGASADAVIKALNGRTLRGRSLRVDYDRKERSQGRPPPRGAPRGGPGRGGADRSAPGRGPARGGGRPGGRGGPRRRD